MTKQTKQPWRETLATDPKEVVGMAVGEASVCWEPMNGTGIFDDKRATAIVDRLLALIEQEKAGAVREALVSTMDNPSYAQRLINEIDMETAA